MSGELEKKLAAMAICFSNRELFQFTNEFSGGVVAHNFFDLLLGAFSGSLHHIYFLELRVVHIRSCCFPCFVVCFISTGTKFNFARKGITKCDLATSSTSPLPLSMGIKGDVNFTIRPYTNFPVPIASWAGLVVARIVFRNR